MAPYLTLPFELLQLGYLPVYVDKLSALCFPQRDPSDYAVPKGE